LEVVRTDVTRGLIFVKGSVPGAKNGWLMVRDAVKHPVPSEAPFPGALKSDNDAVIEEEVIVAPEADAVVDAPAVEAGAPAAEAASVETPVEEAPAADAGEEKKEG
jgi:large subunit ribosomal protein L3